MFEFFEDNRNHRFFGRDMIYHYTSMETAIEYILAEEQLRFSSFRKVNDPSERGIKSLSYVYSERGSLNTLRRKDIELENRIQKNENDLELMNRIRLDECKLLCFSQNDDKIMLSGSSLIDMKKYYRSGFFKPRMWAQYGDKSQGVCIAISKEKLANEIKKSYPSFILYRSQVNYSDSIEKVRMAHKLKNNPDSIGNFREYYINTHVKNNRNEMFFSKNEDWKDENEYRYLLITDNKKRDYYINISSSIEAVFCGIYFRDVYKESLLQYTRYLNIDVYKLSLEDGLPSVNKVL